MDLYFRDKPYKDARKDTRQESGYVHDKDRNYERTSFHRTEHGIVKVTQLDWEHNHGRSTFTRFSTVKNKVNYSAWVEKARLSEKELQSKSELFMRIIVNAYNIK